MITGKVVGNIVSTIKHPALKGYKILLIKPVNPEGKITGKVILAIDTVQAGTGDTVLVMDEGNSGRMITGKKDAPVRTLVVGIVDSININRKRI